MNQPDVSPRDSKKRKKNRHADFWRACRFLWPYRKWVIISICCAFLTGAFTASGLGTMLPLLNVLLEGRTLQGYVEQQTLERAGKLRLAAEDTGYRVLRADDPAVGYKPGDLIPAGDAYKIYTHGVDRVPAYWKWLKTAANYLPTDPIAVIAILFGVLSAFALFGHVGRFFQEYLSDKSAISAINDIRKDLYDHTLRLPVGYFAVHGTGDITARLVTDAQGLQDGFKTVLGKAIQEPIMVIFSLAVAVVVDWRLTLFIIVFAPLMIAVIRKFGTKVRRAMRAALQQNSTMLGQIEATLAGVRVVKSANAEPHELARYARIMDGLKDEQYKMARYEAFSTPVLEMLALVAVGGVLMVASYFVLKDKSLSSSEFLVVMTCLVFIGESLRKVSKLNTVLQKANAAAARIWEALEWEKESVGGGQRAAGREQAAAGQSTAESPQPTHSLPFDRSIRFESIRFSYPGTTNVAVDDVTLEVPKGASVAVVGRNGSGKTTLLSLLPRFYDPDAGRITVDGVDIRTAPLPALRSLIGVVTQDAIVFPGTIHENIAYANPAATRDQVIEASKRAHAHDFILEKPLGYDTPLEGLGSQLSGGQRQRLNIARAILRDTPILILDEATSQVDAESEHAIQQAIEELMHDRTTFVIAHRFSTILAADVIVVLDRGRIVGQGKHDQLLTTCPVYQQLYERQLAGVG
jgi:ABC-type multidrug transport system fused ATPase/permease subunit